MITVYTMAYNEEVMMQFMIDHYRSRFPQCKIVVYDNESTDATAAISLANNCEVITYCTNAQVDDDKLRNLKNNCWKTATTDWVLVCDVDELLEINEDQLKEEDSLGTTIIKSEAYNMVNLEDNYNLAAMDHGSRCSSYDKDYLFKRAVIKEINYVPGGHYTNPVGINKNSSKLYRAYHYINIHPELTFKKYQYTKIRLSEINKKMGWGVHYNRDVPLEEVRSWFAGARSNLIKVR